MNKYPTHPTWDDIQDGCIKFVDTLLDENKPIEAVVGLTRGGLVNAVIVSHLLYDIPVYAVDYSSKHGAGDNISSHSNDVPNIKQRRLLLVDDIADTGHSLKELQALLISRGHTVYTYVSFWKESSALTPDGYQYKIPTDAPWIVMPWE